MPFSFFKKPAEDRVTTDELRTIIADQLSKSLPTKPTKDRTSLQFSPFAFIADMGKYKERTSPVSFGLLRRMSYQTPVISAIINTRTNQVSSFSMPQRDRFSPGFVVRLREVHRPPHKAEAAEMRRISDFIMHTGVREGRTRRDNFDTFLRKVTRDSLTFDQLNFEILPDRLGRPAEFVSVDAATMRRAGSLRDQNGNALMSNTPGVDSVQVIDGRVVAEFSADEMAFGVRNPRNDIYANDYGFGELEQLTSIVTAMLFADEYNKAFFSRGSAPKGILLLRGSYTEAQLESFRRQFWAQVTGVENAWRTPIFQTEDQNGEAQWLDLQRTNREMEYRVYLDYLTRVACAVYLIDPAEINFQTPGGGNSQVTFESKQEQRIKYSRDRGLRPLLQHISWLINKHVVWGLNEDFEFAFEGLNTASKEEMAQRLAGEVSNYRTINEVREERDLPPLPGKEGDIILNQIFIMAKQQEELAKNPQMQQGGMGMPGMPTQGGPPQPGQPPEGQGQGQEEQQLPPGGKTLFDMSPEDLQSVAKSIAGGAESARDYVYEISL